MWESRKCEWKAERGSNTHTHTQIDREREYTCVFVRERERERERERVSEKYNEIMQYLCQTVIRRKFGL